MSFPTDGTRATDSDPHLHPRVLLWLGGCGALVRLLYFSEHAASAFFNVPLLDEKYYDAVARALAAGESVAGLDPGFRPLLYPFFLAAWRRLGGDWGSVLAVAAQHALGIATALAVAALAARLFRRSSAGAWAGALYLLAGPPLFFEGELLVTALFTFLATIQLLLLARLGSKAAAWLVAGAWTALAAQARPNVLIFLAAYPLAALGAQRGRRRMAGAAAAIAGAVVVLIGFGLVQAPFTGHFQLLGGSGGVNFYLGNKRGADGRVPRQDRAVTYGAEYRDSVQVFAEEVYREATGDEGPAAPGRVSRYWLGRGFEEIRSDPGAWLGLLGRKIWYLAWNREIPNNKTYAFVREHESTLLRLLPVRWWLLFALAPLGAVAAWRRGDRRLLGWIVLFAVLYAAGVVLFFVNSRYRLPLWPAMAVLAGGGILALADAARQRRWRELATGLATAAVLASASLVNWLGIPPPSYARDFFFRSLAHYEKGHLGEAEADARRSVELDPSDAAAVFQLGTVALARHHDSQALASFRRAAKLQPFEPRVWNNLGIALERQGRPGEAYRLYLWAIGLAGDYPPPLVNAALLELRAGWIDAAEAKVRRAEELGAESVALLAARAFVERARGRQASYHRALAEAERRDAEVVRRLEEENARPLAPETLTP